MIIQVIQRTSRSFLAADAGEDRSKVLRLNTSTVDSSCGPALAPRIQKQKGPPFLGA